MNTIECRPVLESNALKVEDFFKSPHLPKEKEVDQTVYHLEPKGTIEDSIKSPNICSNGQSIGRVLRPLIQAKGIFQVNTILSLFTMEVHRVSYPLQLPIIELFPSTVLFQVKKIASGYSYCHSK